MNPSKIFLAVVCALYAMLSVASCFDMEAAATVLSRVKRGHGHGHGHGPGKGGGAAGPVYFCGYIGKTQGYGGYGR